MARVSGNVIGNFRGKLGNLSARIVEGDTILSARPSSFNVSQNQASLDARSKFAVTGKLSKHILEDQTLEEIWQPVKLSGMSVYNTVFKKNYPYSSIDMPTINNIITPGGFALPIVGVGVSADDIDIELDALNTVAVFSPEEVNLSMSVVAMYYNPNDADEEPFQIFNVNKSFPAFDFTTAQNIVLTLDVVQQAICSKYQNYIMYFAVASKNSASKVIQHSSTFVNQL